MTVKSSTTTSNKQQGTSRGTFKAYQMIDNPRG